MCRLQLAQDRVALGDVQRVRRPAPLWLVVVETEEDLVGQVVQPDPPILAKADQGPQAVPQLADVAGPLEAVQRIQCVVVDLPTRLAAGLLHEHAPDQFPPVLTVA